MSQSSPVIHFKRGPSTLLTSGIVSFRQGEPGFTTDKYDFYIGSDGTNIGNKFFGSHRYWGRENGTTSLHFKLVDKDGINSINLKSPNTLAGIVTYQLPGTQGSVNSVLTNDGSGNLSWGSGSQNAVFTGITTINGSFLDVNANADFSGITTFSNVTDNILGDANSGAVQIDGGLGINNNFTVGGGSYFTGISSFNSGLTSKNIQIGITDNQKIDTNSGNLYLSSSAGKVIIQSHVDIYNDLVVSGNISLGGTTVTLKGTDVFIENKDIILGYTTSVTPDDTTANHAGVAIASTEGSPLVSFAVSGINTLPDTYKQLMWFKSGTLGFKTDIFAFNYGVAIGTTQVESDVLFAVGSGISMTDDSIYSTNGYFSSINTTNISGSISGTISTATSVNTTGTSDSSTYYMLFSDTSSGENGEIIRVSSGATFVPSSNTLSVSTLHAGTLKSTSGVEALTITGVSGDVGITTNLTVGGSLTVKGSITSINTVNLKVKDQLIDLGLVDDGSGTLIPPSSDANLDVGILLHYYSSGAKTSAVYWDDSATKIVFASDITDSSGVLSPVGGQSGMAHIEIGALSVYDCAGQSQVITCTNSQRYLENITIDAGSF
jgi:hypothetical protein